jgi:hypothetical protein
LAGLRINQDAKLFVTELTSGKELAYDFEPGRHGWLQIIKGSAKVNGTRLETGDAVAVSAERTLLLAAAGTEVTEVMLFDLA